MLRAAASLRSALILNKTHPDRIQVKELGLQLEYGSCFYQEAVDSATRDHWFVAMQKKW